MIRAQNQELFDRFIDFPKPIVVAVNGPALGATVTSATLCDAIIASEHATFSTPFAKLGVTPEGCSSVHLPRLIGAEAAARMLGAEGWVPTADEALAVGLVDEAVPHAALLERAQARAEEYADSGRGRVCRAGATAEELKRINAQESAALADAFLDTPFLMGQYRFLRSRSKTGPALTFRALAAARARCGRGCSSDAPPLAPTAPAWTCTLVSRPTRRQHRWAGLPRLAIPELRRALRRLLSLAAPA